MTFSPAVAAEFTASDALFEIKYAARTPASSIDFLRQDALRTLETNCQQLGYANAAYIARVTASALRAREHELADMERDLRANYEREVLAQLRQHPAYR
ncbi:hypothetical protein GALL_248620 [mine drainage metagenome]|uniref:Uncharacterized protein n=1 Tax=mine drainage metagenome TaxID=410659 RepID=A0A1J5RM31_9ZZZZ